MKRFLTSPPALVADYLITLFVIGMTTGWIYTDWYQITVLIIAGIYGYNIFTISAYLRRRLL